MKAVRRRIIGLFSAAALLAASGCGGDSTVLMPETDEPLYREGQQLEKQGRPDQALVAYLKLIARRGDQAPESDLDVGLIYLGHVKDPIEAIHYFRKYLFLQPNSRLAAYVHGYIEVAKRDFASTLPARPLENQAPRLELADELVRLQRENGELRAELESARAGGGALPVLPHLAESAPDGAGSRPMFSPPPPPIPAEEGPSPLTQAPLPAKNSAPLSAPPVAAPAGRVHTIAHGDTLYLLAQHYYGNRARWHEIFEANRDQLPDEKTPLRLGMVLKIP